MSGETWRITPEERAKHDEQFTNLNPVNGFLNGSQAREFFLRSTLPPSVLGHIWSLADINKDGKMDKKEFSIAMYLIKKKLNGTELPPKLPVSLTFDPSPSFQKDTTGHFSPQAGRFTPMGFQTLGRSSPNLHNVFAPSIQPAIPSPFIVQGGILTSSPTITPPSGPPSGPPPATLISPSEWPISQKLKFKQQFNGHDRQKRGYLNGQEARMILSQTGLAPSILANIWNLADVDKDGKLTSEEFCVAMHLVDISKSGGALPSLLPPELIPPSYRQKMQQLSGSDQSAPAGTDAFSGHVDEYRSLSDAFPNGSPGKGDNSLFARSFEDKRRQNFERGAEELEKRRAALREQMQMENEKREAAERAERERIERARLEAERKKMEEIERHQQMQRQLELEREEARRKAIEQREAARKELERQRQMEWQRQRTEQLLTEKLQQKAALEQLQAHIANVNLELESIEARKMETRVKTEAANNSIQIVTSNIDEMRQYRDNTVREIDTLQNETFVLKERLQNLQAQRYSLQSHVTVQKGSLQEGIINLQKSIDDKSRIVDSLRQQYQSVQKETLEQKQEVEGKENDLRAKQAECDGYRKTVNQMKDEVEIKELEWKNQLDKNKLKNNWSNGDSSWSKASGKKSNDFNAFGYFAPNEVKVEKKPSGFEALNNLHTKEDVFSKPSDAFGDFGAFDSSEATFDKTNNTFEPFADFDSKKETSNKIADAFVPFPDYDSKEVFAENSAKENFSSNAFDSNKATTDQKINVFEAFGTRDSNEAPRNSSTPRSYRVIHTFEARESDELTLQADEIVTADDNMQQGVEPAWIKGTNSRGQIGIFPKDFVELIEEPRESFSEFGSAFSDNFTRKLSFDNNVKSISIDKSATTITEQETKSRCQATYSYSSEVDGDLAFSEGEIIIVTKENGEWWSGYKESDPSKSGVFPYNYVQPIEEEPTLYENAENHLTQDPEVSKLSADGLNNKKQIVCAIAPFKAQGVEQLSFEIGQLIQVRKQSPSGWWEGEILGTDSKNRKIGWFPATYVNIQSNNVAGVRSPSSLSSREPTPAPHPIPVENPPLAPTTAVVLYDYVPRQGDELELSENSVIRIIEKLDSDWWKGESNGKIGLFPSNYVKEQNSSEAYGQQDEISRQKIIKEMLSSEETHLQDLNGVVETFIEPLRAVMTEEDEKLLFVNWPQLIVCSTKLVQAFRVRETMSKDRNSVLFIADVLCEKFQHMQPYVRYCSCQLRSRAHLQKLTNSNSKFAQLLHELEMKQQNMSIESFLLKPMQRVTRYPLLIKRLISATEPKHGEYNQLTEALIAANELCTSVNQAVKEQDNSDKLEWIEEKVDLLNVKFSFNSATNCLGPRKFCYSGSLFKTKSGKELVGFLFNDFFLLTTPHKSLGTGVTSIFSFDTKDLTENNSFKMYKNPLMLNEVHVSAGEELNTFSVSNSDYAFSLKAISNVERDKWVSNIKEASDHYKYTEKRKKERTHSIRRAPALGRVLIRIIEAIDLCPGPNGRCDPYCEMSMGSHEQRTKVVHNSTNPKWNKSMQVEVRDLKNDKLCFSLYDCDPFAPNALLGRTEVRASDLLPDDHFASTRTPGAVQQKLKLLEAVSGELVVKLDLQLYSQS